MRNRRSVDNFIEYERLILKDDVVYKGKYYFVSEAYWVDTDGMQMVYLIRHADFESNRTKIPSIKVRACECKIIKEAE